jgi:adenylate cyclase
MRVRSIHNSRILAVDDQQDNLDLLEAFLGDAGYQNVLCTRDPRETLDIVRRTEPDLIVLDLHMPHMDGFAVLEALRPSIPEGTYLPILVLTADATVEARQRALAAGARDFLTKPLEETETLLRIRNLLETRALHVELKERNAALEEANRQLDAARETSERLLLNVLPRSIAERLKRDPGTIADSFDEATVLFSDIAGFTHICEQSTPEQLVAWLGDVFAEIDALAEKFGLEKIKTVGDAYMLACGIPTKRHDHAEAVAEFALSLLEATAGKTTPAGKPLRLRIGMHTGRVVAGVIGTRRFAYDLWGDTVNIASRMQTHSPEGAIQTSPMVFKRLHDRYEFTARGEIPIKGKGTLQTYLLIGRKGSCPSACG